MKLKDVTTESFKADVLDALGLVVVDFWAPWCGPCKMVAPVLEALADDHRDITIVKVNADEHPELVGQYEVSSIPTLKVFSGGVVVHTIVGAKPRPALVKELTAWL
jgi:thioredoxin 1